MSPEGFEPPLIDDTSYELDALSTKPLRPDNSGFTPGTPVLAHFTSARQRRVKKTVSKMLHAYIVIR